VAEWTRETPLRSPEYDALLDEYAEAEDRHKRYLLHLLVRWHVPVPWASWTSFAANYQPSEREPE
jgi:hypothetical protein